MSNDLKKGQKIIASRHTHSGDTGVRTEKINGKNVLYSTTNQFSDGDIDLYKKINPNPFNTQIKGYVVTPNGGLLFFDPNQNYENVNIKGILCPPLTISLLIPKCLLIKLQVL